MNRVIPYRVVALGLLVVAIGIGILIAARPHDSNPTEPDTEAVGNCPAQAPEQCFKKVAGVWKVDATSVPSVATPAGMHYARGFIAKKASPPAIFFTFTTTLPGNTQPSEISLKMFPAPTKPLRAPKGARLRTLPSGRTYVDASGAQRSGPYVERVGGYEIVISMDPSLTPARLTPAKLALLAAVTDAH